MENGFFQIDSDEILERNAEKIIRQSIETVNENIDCFQMPRKTMFLANGYNMGDCIQIGNIGYFEQIKEDGSKKRFTQGLLCQEKLNI